MTDEKWDDLKENIREKFDILEEKIKTQLNILLLTPIALKEFFLCLLL